VKVVSKHQDILLLTPFDETAVWQERKRSGCHFARQWNLGLWQSSESWQNWFENWLNRICFGKPYNCTILGVQQGAVALLPSFVKHQCIDLVHFHKCVQRLIVGVQCHTLEILGEQIRFDLNRVIGTGWNDIGGCTDLFKSSYLGTYRMKSNDVWPYHVCTHIITYPGT